MKQFWQENKGSISTFAIISIIAVLMILFLSINIGNIFAKKSLVEDTAEAIAPILLDNQFEPTLNTPQIFAQNLIDKIAGLSSATQVQISFGMLNNTTNDPSLPDGFYPFGDSKSGNPTISPINPDFNNVTYTPGTQDFAVEVTISHNATPLGNMLNFTAINLTGVGRAATQIDKLPQHPDIVVDPDSDCCCRMAGEMSDKYITKEGFLTCHYGTKLPIIPCIVGVVSVCDSYFDCRGRLIENFFKKRIFSSFLDQIKCWFPEFKARIEAIQSTIRSVNKSVWDGVTN